MNDRDSVQAEKQHFAHAAKEQADIARKTKIGHAVTFTSPGDARAHEASAHPVMHPLTGQARYVDRQADYPSGPIGRGHGDYRGSDLAPPTYNKATSKNKGQNIRNAHELPRLAGGDYV